MNITDEIIAKYISGHCNEFEKASVEEYMAKNDENADDVLKMTVSAYSYIIDQKEMPKTHTKKLTNGNRTTFNMSGFYRYAAVVAVLVVVGIGIWQHASAPKVPHFDFDDPVQYNNAGFSGGSAKSNNRPCEGEYGDTYSMGDVPEEWVWEEDKPLVIRWESDAPMQRLDYRFNCTDKWISKDVSKTQSFSFTSDEIKNAMQVEIQITVGCDEQNYDIIFDGKIKIIHQK